MIKVDINNKFDIRDEVYYSTDPESTLGIVIDISYSLRNNDYKYCVSFSHRVEDEVWLNEEELSYNKSII